MFADIVLLAALANFGSRLGDVVVPPPYTTVEVGNRGGIGTFTQGERCWSDRGATVTVLDVEEKRAIVLYRNHGADPTSKAFCPDGTVGYIQHFEWKVVLRSYEKYKVELEKKESDTKKIEQLLLEHAK